MTKGKNDKELTLTVTYFDKVTRDFIDYYSERDLKKRDAMDRPDYGGYETLSAAGGPFICSIEGNAIKAEQYVFMVYFLPDDKRLQVQALIGADRSPIISEPAPKEYRNKKAFADKWYRYADDFQPIAAVISDYKLTTGDLKQFKSLMSRAVDPRVNEDFGGLLKAVLEDAGYQVFISPLRAEYFYGPTIEHVTQRIYSADKRGNFLSDLMSVGRKSGISSDSLLFDEKGIEVIGFKIDVDIPSKRASKGSVQLSFDFDFRQEDGFKVIPLKKLEDRETKDKLNKTLQKIEQKISKDLDPLTLRVKDAILCMSQDKANRKFDFTENELLDLLYTRKQRGAKAYHGTNYKKRVRERLQLISKIKLSYAVKIGNKTIGVDDLSPIILNPEGKPFIEYSYTNGKAKKRYNFQSIEIPERYYNLFFGNYAGQFNRESLMLQGIDYNLYKFIATWWRIEWTKRKGIYQWWLSDILIGAGITPPTKKNTARFVSNLTAVLDEMKKNKLIGSYKRLDKNKNPIADMWRFEAPVELKERLKPIGKQYQDGQEMKNLRAEKRKLKLESDIIELKRKE